MGVKKPSKEHRPSDLRRSDYLLEGNCLIAGEVCRWGTEREKVRMSEPLLRERVMICRHSYPGRYDEPQTEHETDHDDRRIGVRILSNRSCWKELLCDLGSRRSFFLGEKFRRRNYGRRTAGWVIERQFVSSPPAEYGKRQKQESEHCDSG